MLSVLVFFPLFSAIVLWLFCRRYSYLAWWGTLIALVLLCMYVLGLWVIYPKNLWIAEGPFVWIEPCGIYYSLALDGFGLMMIAVTLLVSSVAVMIGRDSIASWSAFGPLLLWTVFGLMGVFLAYDMMLFYCFWEMMLIPMFFMMIRWGSVLAQRAAIRFLIMTVACSLIMLVGIIVLGLMKTVMNGKALSFEFSTLLEGGVPHGIDHWIMLAFILGFGVKVPLFPLHVWAPEAYRESHPIVAMVLSGAMSNAGIYGLLRIFPFLSPSALTFWQEVGMALTAIGAIYAGLIAYSQDNMRSVIAYSSISHMNIGLLAVFALQLQAMQGAMILLVAHALSITGLFAVITLLYRSGFDGSLSKMGGLFTPMPRLGAFFLFFIVASIGMPGLGNFVAEILIFAGSYQISALWTVVAAVSIVVGVAYFLKLYERVMLGPFSDQHRMALTDINWREWWTLMILVIAILWLGLYPNHFIDRFASVVHRIMQIDGVGR